jgi:tRNA(Ile2) C34 agmatinyltransferase TiaS
MTIKEAVKWMKAFKKVKFKCVVPTQVSEAIDLLMKEKRCLICGKKMQKLGDYEYKCNCWPKNVRLSVG